MIRNVRAGMERTTGFSMPLLSDDEFAEVHAATLEILEHTGFFVASEEALDVFADGGANVDRATKIVRLPQYLVEDAIRTAPSKLFLAGRDPKHDIILESSRVGFTTFGEGILVKDINTGELRAPTKEDVADAARLADALSEIDVYERAVGAHEVPQEVGQLHNAEATFNNTAKHVFMGPFDGYQLNKIVEMAALISGGMNRLQERPLITFITCPVSPLKLVQDTCEVIMEGAKSGMAVNILSMAMAGGSSPVTLAGTLVNHNAEVLAGVTLSQLTRKGAKIIYGSSTTAMDLKLASASVGSPECAIINALVARLAKYYALPSFVAGG